MTKSFPLGAVLTVTTGGTMLCKIDELYELLNFMTSDSLFTHQLPRALRECQGPLLEQHPQLRDVAMPDGLIGSGPVLGWLHGIEGVYGAELVVAPLDPDDHTVIDPVTELSQMMPGKPIIAVVVPESDR